MAHTPSPSPKPRRARWRRVVLVATGVVVGAVVLVWLAAPLYIESRLKHDARERAGIDLQLESLSLLRNPMAPVRLRGLVATSIDTPTSPALSINTATLAWAAADTPRAADGSMMPPRLIVDGPRVELLRDRSGAVNFRPRRDSVSLHEDEPSSNAGSGGNSPTPVGSETIVITDATEVAKPSRPPRREASWLTDIVVRDLAFRAAHDSNDSKTRGAMELRLDHLRVLRHPPAAPADDPRIERLDVAFDGFELDGPLGWGDNLAMLQLPSLRATMMVPANTDDEKVRLASLIIDGGMVRRARDLKGRWQETHVQRIVKSLRDKKPPKPDDDDAPTTQGLGSGASQGELLDLAAPDALPAPVAENPADAPPNDDRNDWPIVERAEVRDLDWILEATTPAGFESVAYHIDRVRWIGAAADEETALPATFALTGDVGDGGSFTIEWTRTIEPSTKATTAIALTMTTRALPFHPLVWGAWKHDRPELGEVRRALLDADYSLSWDAQTGELRVRGTFAFREVDVAPDARSMWQRLAEPAPSAWPTILADLTPPGSTDAAPIIIDHREPMAEFDAFAVWHAAQDAFVAARLKAADALKAQAGQAAP